MVPVGEVGGQKTGNYFYKILYIGNNLLKWNAWPISIKLATNISCMMGIKIYSNEGPSPLQRGDNHESAKIG
jgi:hypothetical protein